ncbi:hypothetical protein INR49_029361 [Caranx melampygus]|nr:hypothetical protein INR49_029361 [Caranx melampygus]
MWMCIATFLLWTRSGGCTEKANTSDLIEYTAADFYEKLHSGKMMFIYFEHKVSPTISLFLVELEKSAEVLQDYGVLVGKVNCNKELVHNTAKTKGCCTQFFCSGSAILREEVKYVHTDADLLAMEKAARGQKDMVLGYVRSLGTQEHRSMMETAYVYGTKYQFILITGGPVLKHLGVNESSHSSQVWFLHCRVHSGFMTPLTSERCPLTRMRKPLSILSLHSFLQLMEAPLVCTTTLRGPAPTIPLPADAQVFLFSHPATEHLDLDTATTLAWRLRGIALLLLVHRQSPAVKTPNEYNAAYRLPEKSLEVKYMTLYNLDEVLELFTNEEKRERRRRRMKRRTRVWRMRIQSLEIWTMRLQHLFTKNRGNLLDMDSINQLTSDNSTLQ